MRTPHRQSAFNALPIIKTESNLQALYVKHIFNYIQKNTKYLSYLLWFKDLRINNVSLFRHSSLLFPQGTPPLPSRKTRGGGTLTCGGRGLGSAGSIRITPKTGCSEEPGRSDDGCFKALTMQFCLLSSAPAKAGHTAWSGQDLAAWSVCFAV